VDLIIVFPDNDNKTRHTKLYYNITMNKLEYHIYIDDSFLGKKLIASFAEEVDADICLGAFQEMYPEFDFVKTPKRSNKCHT
jgi:hypothetical protein